MSYQTPAKCVVISIVILLMVLGMTFGMVCHHHADCSAVTCPLCHLVIVPMVTGVQTLWVPMLIGTVSETTYVEPVARSVSRLPARAPPA